MKVLKKHIFWIIIGSAVILFALVLFLYPSQISLSVYEGMSLCYSVLVPSLFPFVFLSMFIVQSGIADKLGRLLNPVVKRLFKLPGSAGAAILISCIGGYHSGAQAINQLYKSGSITRAQAERMMYFCVCAGPAFLVSTLGNIYFGNSVFGAAIYAAQILSSLIIGVILGIFAKKDVNYESCKSMMLYKPLPESFVDCARGTASAMLSISSFVVLFSVIICILDVSSVLTHTKNLFMNLGLSEELSCAILPNLLEVTGEMKSLVPVGLPYAAFMVSFGGFCVHFQIFSFVSEIKISKLKFTISRIAHGLLCAGITWLLLKFIDVPAAVSADISRSIPIASSSPTGAISLIILCVVTVLAVPGERVDKKKILC